MTLNARLLDSFASATGSDKSHQRGAEKCLPASSRSASPESGTSEERLKLQNEVAQLRKTIERNEATAALELDLNSIKHELEIQKLKHEQAMLRKDLESEKERSTQRMSPPEKPARQLRPSPGVQGRDRVQARAVFQWVARHVFHFVTEILFACPLLQTLPLSR